MGAPAVWRTTQGAQPSALVEHVREAMAAFRYTISEEYQQFLGGASGPEGVDFVSSALVDGKPEAKAPEALYSTSTKARTVSLFRRSTNSMSGRGATIRMPPSCVDEYRSRAVG
jgi:hypothetical protein